MLAAFSFFAWVKRLRAVLAMAMFETLDDLCVVMPSMCVLDYHRYTRGDSVEIGVAFQ